MADAKRHHEVWAQFLLARSDQARIRAFFVDVCGVRPDRVVQNMHLTVYHARRPLPGIVRTTEPVTFVLPAEVTRFMVMAPGGENPRPNLEPAFRKVGIRIRRNTEAMATILAYRRRLLAAETAEVLGARRPSDHRRNAFGARHFQAHMTLLKAGSGIDRDLTKVGELFRSTFDLFKFDRFAVDVVPPGSIERQRDRPLDSRPARFANGIRWTNATDSRGRVR
jgi:hypothetical protein